MVSYLFTILTIFSVARAKPTARANMKVHESRHSIPPGFVHTGSAPADTELKLRIALVQSDPEGLVNALYDVSTPSSAAYGQHLSQAEVRIYPLVNSP